VAVKRDFELRNAERRWLIEGQSALPVVRLLEAQGATVEAGAVARLALTRPDCPDAAELGAILDRLAASPAGWTEALTEFAKAPSVERWQELMRFVPPEYLFQRHREAVRRLRALGVDGNMLFRCGSEYGLTPDLIGLVEDGCVSVSTLVERAAASRGAKTAYLGLAAEAAFLSGDMLGTVRLLREAMVRENEWLSVYPHVFFIRERASAEQKDFLDRAGVPQI
jgi:hypothetical protein